MKAEPQLIEPVTDEKRPAIFEGLKIIDTDTHYVEPPDFWLRNAPAKFKNRVPRLEERDGKQTWVIEEGQDFGRAGGSLVINDKGQKAHGAGNRSHIENFGAPNPAAWDVKKRVAFMDYTGIHAQVAFPQATGFSSVGMIEKVKDVELRTEMIRLFNQGGAEVQQQSGDRILPQALLPVWDKDATLAEMQRCKDAGQRGFTVADSPEHSGLPSYDEPYWEGFWDFLNQTKMVLNFHIGGSAVFDAFQVPWKNFGPERNLAIAATMFYMSNAGTIANFLMSGIFDTYPNLRIASVESGVGWIPFLIEALEYQFDEMVATERVHVQRRPKEYFRDHISACFWFEEKAARNAIEYFDGNNLTFETDFPHSTCLYPAALTRAAEGMKGVKPEHIQKVFQDNGANLYGVTA